MRCQSMPPKTKKSDDDWIQEATDPKTEGSFAEKAKRAKMTTRAYAAKVVKRLKGRTTSEAQKKLLRQAVMAQTLMRKGKAK